MSKPTRFYALDSFRGICALSVVIFHLHITGSVTTWSFFRNADIFVELFFVLSGFVIAHTYSFNPQFNLQKFFISRSFRLFPLHLAMLVVIIVLELGKLIAHRYGLNLNSPPFTGPTAPQELVPNILLLQSWSHYSNPLSFNFPAWSISVEYYMYLIFAVLLALAGSARYLAWFAVSTLSFIGLYTNSALMTEEAMRGLSCFFAGALTYLAYRRVHHWGSGNSTLMSLLELAVLSAVIWLLSSDLAYRSILASLLFCGVVLVFALEGGVVSRFLNLKPFIYFGKLSFSIYLTHAAILFCVTTVLIVLEKAFKIKLAHMVGPMRHFDLGNAVLNNLLVVAILGLVVLISGITYQYIEMAGQRVGKRLLEMPAADGSATTLRP